MKLHTHGTHNNFLLKIVAAIVLFFIIPLAGFLFGMQYQDLIDANNKPMVEIPKKIANKNSINDASVWKEHVFQIDNLGKILNLKVSLPPTWTVKEISDPANTSATVKKCLYYEITNANVTAVLTIRPFCRGWIDIRLPIPADGVVIGKKQGPNALGGVIDLYSMRIEEKDMSYSYSQTTPVTTTRQLDKEKDKMMNAYYAMYPLETQQKVSSPFLPVAIKLKYGGNSTDLDANLSIADKIVNSLIIE